MCIVLDVRPIKTADERLVKTQELGDLFYTVVFYAKVAERENKFTMRDIITRLKTKLIRRHPHVYGEASKEMDEIVKNWEKIKGEEKTERKSALDGIPKTLPSIQGDW